MWLLVQVLTLGATQYWSGAEPQDHLLHVPGGHHETGHVVRVVQKLLLQVY